MIHKLNVLILAISLLFSVNAFAQSDLGQMKTVKTQHTEIHYPARFEPVVADFSKTAEDASARLETTLQLESWETVQVWLLPKVSDYYHHHNIPVRSPSWAAGLSLSDKSVVIVAHGAMNGQVHDIHKTLQHELAHVGIDRAKKGAPIPRWFHEGFAVWFADEWTADRSERLTQAANFGGLKSFSEIERTFPSHQLSVSIAYDQSFHFVRWLKEAYGDDVYAKILHGMPEEKFAESFKNSTTDSLAFAEAKWKARLQEDTSGWSILRDSTLVFFGVTLLFVVAFLIRRKRNKQQIESMTDDPGAWAYDQSRYPLPGAQNNN